MSWLLAIGLALLAGAVAVWLLGVPRNAWTTWTAALALGLAGYALQASPGLPGAPAPGSRQLSGVPWNSIEARKEMALDDERPPSNGLVMADAYSRQRRYAEAAEILRHSLARMPQDAEAWLALGNALVDHADGALTEPALYAYRRSEEAAPGSAGPGYFLGLALIRQGRLQEASDVWRSTLEGADADAPGRAALQVRLARLDELLANPALVPQQDTR